MQPKTIIFIGPQGSGKGTQVELLKEKLAEVDKECFITHIQTGKPFRDLASAGGYTADLIKNLINNGKMVPDVLTNALVVNEFIDDYVEEGHIVLDGYPRTEAQAKACTELFAVYNRKKVDVVHLKTDKEVVVKRMLERGREDDTEDAIQERLNRYHKVTEPLLDFYQAQENVTIHVVDAGQTIEEVQVELCKALNIA